jgi:hypothetical protein
MEIEEKPVILSLNYTKVTIKNAVEALLIIVAWLTLHYN